jgi:pimeloyl-ACP methyl ester carboxylesterase
LTDLVFSHANGFPASTYAPMLRSLRAAGVSVHALEKFGHNPRFPVTDNWPHLLEELMAFTNACVGARRKVVFVGHSFGGYLSLMAACRHPQRAAGVVMLDSPVVGGWRALLLRTGKQTGLAARYSPGAVSVKRREHWPSREAAHEHFSAKRAFARMDPRCLDAYIRHGLQDAPTNAEPCGVELAFGREVETAIYNLIPDNLARWAARHPPQCPVAFIGAHRSAEIRQAGMAASERIANAGARPGGVQWVDGSHLFPLEDPTGTARLIKSTVKAFL